MRLFKIYLLLLVSGVALSSCQEDITTEIPEYESKLAVSCILDPEEDSIMLTLGESHSYFNYADTNYRQPGRFKDAVVDIKEEGGGTSVFKYLNIGGGPNGEHYFSGAVKSSPGKRYFLTVTHAGRTLRGETRIPATPVFDSLKIQVDTVIERFDPRDPGRKVYLIRVFVKDPAGENNFYSIENDLQGNFETNYTEDAGFDGKEVELVTSVREENFDTTGMPRPLPDYIRVRVISTEAGTARYARSVQEQRGTSGTPFTEPVILRHNVTDGLGVFGSGTKSKWVRVKIK